MQKDTRLFLGITLLSVPTIVYGGLTLLSIITGGQAGTPGPQSLSLQQVALYRAGHAHAGVLLLLSLILQICLEHARLGQALRRSARVAAPLAAILVSGGFFGLAHLEGLRLMLYAGAASLVFATVLSGVGLVRQQ